MIVMGFVHVGQQDFSPYSGFFLFRFYFVFNQTKTVCLVLREMQKNYHDADCI